MFLTKWSKYAKDTCLPKNDFIFLLLECCDEPIRKYLATSEGGSLFDKTKEQVLDSIKCLFIQGWRRLSPPHEFYES